MSKITRLKNGLTIITEKKKGQEVCIGVLVKAGLINETDAQNGISHFLEHMAFKGTATKSAKELAESIESLGGSCNAYTSVDHTLYHVDLLAEHWKTGIQFLNDIVIHSTFPKEELERERKVILQEIARSKDNPMRVFYNHLKETIYAEQNIGRTVLGPAENIEKFTREDLIDYVKTYYVPNNMIVSVCGNVSHHKVAKFVKQLFGDLKPKQVTETLKADFVTQSKMFEEIFDQSMTAIVYKGPCSNDNEEVVCNIFKNVLDGGMSCRLFQEMREKHGLCYSTFFIGERLKDSGFIGTYAGVKENDVDKALTVMEQIINTMKTEISDEELTKAKNITLYQYAKLTDGCLQMMRLNAKTYMYKGKEVNIKKRIKEIKKTTKKQVFDFAEKYITSEASKIIIVHKKEK